MAYFLVFMQFQAFSSPGAVPAAELATLTVQLAEYYNVDPQLAAAVILAESGGRAHAVNARTHDYGLMQINARQAKQLHMTQPCLMDWKCNLTFGLQHFSKLKRPCLYNLGQYRRVTGRYETLCKQYEAKLTKYASL